MLTDEECSISAPTRKNGSIGLLPKTAIFLLSIFLDSGLLWGWKEGGSPGRAFDHGGQVDSPGQESPGNDLPQEEWESCALEHCEFIIHGVM